MRIVYLFQVYDSATYDSFVKPWQRGVGARDSTFTATERAKTFKSKVNDISLSYITDLSRSPRPIVCLSEFII